MVSLHLAIKAIISSLLSQFQTPPHFVNAKPVHVPPQSRVQIPTITPDKNAHQFREPPLPLTAPLVVTNTATVPVGATYATVVPVNPTPPGPTLTVTPSNTSVVGVAPGPIVKVIDPITTRLAPISENVMPPAVTASVCMARGGGATVVPPAPAMPMPPGPILTVTPLTTSVVGDAWAPSVKVLEPRTTTLDPISEKVRPAAVTTCVGFPFGGGKSVVPWLPTPLGPMLNVWPWTTTVVGAAAGPRVKVWLPRRRVEPISVSVTWFRVAIWVAGGGGVGELAGWRVVLPIPTPLGPMETVCP